MTRVKVYSIAQCEGRLSGGSYKGWGGGLQNYKDLHFTLSQPVIAAGLHLIRRQDYHYFVTFLPKFIDLPKNRNILNDRTSTDTLML